LLKALKSSVPSPPRRALCLDMFFCLALLAAGASVTAASIADDTPLTRTPTIMTHDAATGYLGGGLISRWAKTQPAPFAGQLDCGARAFDARPQLDSKKGLVWHHGSDEVSHPFADSISEIIQWCGKNPTELVLLPISACSGDGCMDAVNKALAAAGVRNLQSCGSLKGLTYGGAKKLGALPGGGALLAITGPSGRDGTACSSGNYDPSQACTGDDGFEALNDDLYKAAQVNEEVIAPRTSFDCWNGSKTADIPVNRLLTYLDGVASGGLSDGMFTQHQALWQESVRSVVIGTLRGSSLLMDEQKSGLNSIITHAVKSGRWKEVNFLEVNNVCDGGLELLDALRNMQLESIVV